MDDVITRHAATLYMTNQVAEDHWKYEAVATIVMDEWMSLGLIMRWARKYSEHARWADIVITKVDPPPSESGQ